MILVLLAMAAASALMHARRRPALPGHDTPGPGRPLGHKNCANCADYALEWRADLIAEAA